MVVATKIPTDPVDYVTEDEGRKLFDAQTRKLLGLSADEFLGKWDAGEYQDVADQAGSRHIMHLAMLIPFGRQEQ